MRKSKRVVMFMVLAIPLLCWSVILSLPKKGFAFTLPDTGQTKCYNTAGTEISCTGSGQDGAYNLNLMSYTDNGTITDNVTGLMWQKEDDNTTRNLADAGTYCDSLTLGGHSDWRLPTKKELMSIVDYSIPYPGPAINTTYFPNTYANNYWVSTTYAYGTGFAWYVGFGSGYVDGDGKSHSNYVRCVRGGQSSTVSFTNNGNGTVTDNGTGLMWQQGEPGQMTWANALSYCEGLSLGVQSDWRLPNIKELESITDDTKYNSAIDITYFPNTYAGLYWSSTTSAYGADGAWGVSFYVGDVHNYNKTYSSYVRCVRAGQSGSTGGSQNNCAASVSSSLVVHIPIVTYSGSNYWADLQYNSATSILTVADAGAVTDASSYSSCTAPTLSSDFKLHIPVVMLGGVSYWADLQYNGSVFTVAGAGQN